MHSLTILIAACFAALTLLHFSWLFRPMGMAILPHENGQPAFKPGKPITLAVAIALGLATTLVLNLHPAFSFLPMPVVKFGNGAIAFVMGARAIGDFRYCGLFRRRKTPVFTARDTWLYTPFCLAVSVGLGYAVLSMT
jgi:hypothetical protein